MNINNIILVLGEPYSTFSEIIAKYFINKKINKKIILVGNYNLLKSQLSKLNYNLKFNKIKKLSDSKKNILNIYDVDFEYKETFTKLSNKSNKYIKTCFSIGLNLVKKVKKSVLINGPVSKKTFLRKKYLGITEYLSNKTKSKNEVMLIYNDTLSVSPLTTHIPLKQVNKNITKKKIVNNVIKINSFYKNCLKKNIKFAVLGLNPHCETVSGFSEEDKIISPAILYLKKSGLNISGPFSADTFFLKNNIKKYDVVIGMYHDQVLTPIKTLFEFKAINITLGLPFIRISPDHGPNSEMLGKNISDPSSFFYAMDFIKKLK